MELIRIGDVVYFARVHHETAIYEICELHVRTVYPECFVGVDIDTKQAFLISINDIGRTVFDNRNEALAVVKEAEKDKKELTKGGDE